MVRPLMMLTARLLLDLGRVEQRGHDCSRADSYRDARFYQLIAALFIRLIEIVVAVAHNPISMAFGGALEVA